MGQERSSPSRSRSETQPLSQRGRSSFAPCGPSQTLTTQTPRPSPFPQARSLQSPSRTKTGGGRVWASRASQAGSRPPMSSLSTRPRPPKRSRKPPASSSSSLGTMIRLPEHPHPHHPCPHPHPEALLLPHLLLLLLQTRTAGTTGVTQAGTTTPTTTAQTSTTTGPLPQTRRRFTTTHRQQTTRSHSARESSLCLKKTMGMDGVLVPTKPASMGSSPPLTSTTFDLFGPPPSRVKSRVGSYPVYDWSEVWMPSSTALKAATPALSGASVK